jgi:hypothetical protein
MGVTAGIFLASILLKEMRYLVCIRYLWYNLAEKYKENFDFSREGLRRDVSRVDEVSLLVLVFSS